MYGDSSAISQNEKTGHKTSRQYGGEKKRGEKVNRSGHDYAILITMVAPIAGVTAT